jgi:hypothetical protein
VLARKRQPVVPAVLLLVVPAVALGGCATSTTATGGQGNAYLIAIAGFTVVFAVTTKATAVMTAALADLMAVIRRLIAAMAMFASAAAVAGAGLALVTWFTFS